MMKRYDKYKESGTPWIGKIPEHWEVKRLGSFAMIKTGTTPPTSNISYYDGDILWFTPGDFSNDGIALFSSERTLTQKAIAEQHITLFPANSVLMVCIGATLGRIGIASVASYANQQINAIIPGKRILPQYIAYWLLVNRVYVGLLATSATLPILNQERTKSLPNPLPPLSEQEAIVAYLEEKVAQMDSLVAKQEAQIAYLRELKQAIIARAVTRGLDPQVPLRPSGIPWIGNIPKHWEVRMLSQLSQEYFVSNKDIKHQNLLSLSYGRIIQRDIDTTEGLLPASYDTYQVIRRENIVLRLTDLQNDHKSLRVGLSTQEGIITSAYLTLASRSNVNPKFLYFSLHTADIKKVFYGMGSGLRQNLNWKELRKLCLPLPPPSEQEAIVTYINRKTEEIDHLIAMTEREIARVRELKQTLIADVVTGRINVQPS